MKQLINAIVTKFNATSALTSALTGGIWLDKVPEGTARPYCRISIINNPITQCYGAGEIEDIRVQFDCFAIGADVVATIQDTLHSTFDTASLTLSSNRHISTDRLNVFYKWEATDENNEEVYRSMSEYRFKVQKGF